MLTHLTPWQFPIDKPLTKVQSQSQSPARPSQHQPSPKSPLVKAKIRKSIFELGLSLKYKIKSEEFTITFIFYLWCFLRESHVRKPSWRLYEINRLPCSRLPPSTLHQTQWGCEAGVYNWRGGASQRDSVCWILMDKWTCLVILCLISQVWRGKW